MELPSRSWSNTLRRLGLWRAKQPWDRRPRPLAMERLEGRELLTTTVDISANPSTADEGGTRNFVVFRDNTTGSLTVNYNVGGTATSGSDYTALSGSVTIANGATEATIELATIDDSTVESNESVIVTLQGSFDYNVLPLHGTATITIVDNEPVPPTVSVTASGTPAEGGNSGTFTISRTGSTASSLAVSYTMSGTATNGTDYSSLTGSVTLSHSPKLLPLWRLN